MTDGSWPLELRGTDNDLYRWGQRAGFMDIGHIKALRRKIVDLRTQAEPRVST